MYSASDILKLKRQLLPQSRAFKVPYQSDFERLLLGMSDSEARLLSDGIGVLDKIIPDNDNFSVKDADKWESLFGIETTAGVSLDERKTTIFQRMAFPNNQLARQHYKFIEKQLQDAGFDVYVHEFFNVDDEFDELGHGDELAEHGAPEAEHGAVVLPIPESIVSDFINKNRESIPAFTLENLRSTFWIGGENFPDFTNVDANRERELRQLILKLKPIHTIGFLLINYT